MRLRSTLVLLILASGFAQRPSFDEFEGKFPVILERTPYNKDDSDYLTEFVRSGYIAIAQDTRGRYHPRGIGA